MPRLARPVYRLQIVSAEATVWRAPLTLETSLLVEAMQMADRLARACRRAAPPDRNATRTWVVELTGESGGVLYRAPVLHARPVGHASSVPACPVRPNRAGSPPNAGTWPISLF